MLQKLKEDVMDIVRNAGNTSYLTHGFHPYSAKFVPQIPEFFINEFTKEGDHVFDPYCGSGTTLVEAKRLSRNSTGIDLHPLAAFMSRVKTTKIPTDEIDLINPLLEKMEVHISSYVRKHYDDTLLSFIESEPQEELEYDLPEFKNRDHWFQSNVLHELAIVRSCIDTSNLAVATKDLLRLALSSIVVSVSNQESETRYASIDKKIAPFHTFSHFMKKAKGMIDQMRLFNEQASGCSARVFEADTRYIDFMETNSIDFIMTSPPYPNTYDYYLYHKIRMILLGMKWEHLMKDEIGSRLRHSSRREPITEFVKDMKECFVQLARVTKPGGYAIIVMGDSIIRKELISGAKIIREISEPAGFTFIDSMQYDQGLASKTFNKAFRSSKKEEHIILLRNGEGKD